MAAGFEVQSHPCNGSLHAKAVFERAQAHFNAGSPALATPKPALFLSHQPAMAKRPKSVFCNSFISSNL
jgi:hypothetical protein